MATIAERLKTALEIREIKQTELVKRTGIGKSSISTYLSGEYEPKQGNIYKIAKALDVNEAWLMGFDVEMERRDPLSALLVSAGVGGQDINDPDAYLKDFVAYGDKEAKQIMISLFQALQSVAKDYSDEDLAGLIKLGKKVLATPPEMFETVSTVVNAILK